MQRSREINNFRTQNTTYRITETYALRTTSEKTICILAEINLSSCSRLTNDIHRVVLAKEPLSIKNVGINIYGSRATDKSPS